MASHIPLTPDLAAEDRVLHRTEVDNSHLSSVVSQKLFFVYGGRAVKAYFDQMSRKKSSVYE